MKYFFSFVIFTFSFSINSFSQGCVAVRGTGGMCMLAGYHDSSRWQLNISNRYFHSYKHFISTEEQKQRVELGTEVINHTYTGEISAVYKLNNRWSFSLMVPIISNSRSSLYEHGGNRRETTRSFGMGDIRFTAYAMLLNPETHTKFNIQVGLGLKLATGDYQYMDYFYNGIGGAKQLGPVDQSIQLGDGGTGFTTELNTYYNFNRHFSLYGSFFYLISPREQNGVSTGRGNTVSAATISYGSDVMSVPDQYMYRAGLNYSIKNLAFSAGVRKECIPVKNLVGGSNGFRRPGYIVSLEPGVTYKIKKVTIYALIPIALERNRMQSVPEKIKTDLTGVYTQGDAAFADYSLNFGISFKL